MTEPLIPPEIDLRGLPWMRLDTVRLLDSDLFALATGDEFKAAVALWCKAWGQIPAGSLPKDDRILAHLSGAGPKWRRLRDMAMRGWVECSDGRLYHHVVAEQVLAAWEERQEFREKLESQSERQRRHREERAALMADLKAAGVHLAWNAPITEIRARHDELSHNKQQDKTDQSQTCHGDSHGLDGTGRDGKSFSSSNPARTDPSEGSAPELARALHGAGFPDCSPSFPDLVAAKREGVTPQELAAVAIKAAGKPLAYVIQAARGKRADAAHRAADKGEAPKPAPDPRVLAVAAARHQRDDQVLTAEADCRNELIDEATRDQRVAAARSEFQRFLDAAGHQPASAEGAST